MKQWVTKIKAISSFDGELKEYIGPNVPGFTQAMAQHYCEENGLGYCEVIGQFIAEIPMKNGKADFDRAVDYQIPELN